MVRFQSPGPIPLRSVLAALCAAGVLAGCSMGAIRPAPAPAVASAVAEARAPGVPAASVVPAAPATALALGYASAGAGLDALIAHYARHYGVPERLVRRVIVRESNYNPAARNGPNLGLMQIQHATATTMGYRGGADGLLDADTNLRYAVRYLAGAYLVAGRDEDKAIRLYAAGYYYEAKRLGLVEHAGLR